MFHEQFTWSFLRKKSQGLNFPKNSNWFEFVGLVAGTKVGPCEWILKQKWTIYSGTCPLNLLQELVAGITPLMCADLKSNLNIDEPIVGPCFHSIFPKYIGRTTTLCKSSNHKILNKKLKEYHFYLFPFFIDLSAATFFRFLNKESQVYYKSRKAIVCNCLD